MEKNSNEYPSMTAFNLVSNVLYTFEHKHQSYQTLRFLLEICGHAKSKNARL